MAFGHTAVSVWRRHTSAQDLAAWHTWALLSHGQRTADQRATVAWGSRRGVPPLGVRGRCQHQVQQPLASPTLDLLGGWCSGRPGSGRALWLLALGEGAGLPKMPVLQNPENSRKFQMQRAPQGPPLPMCTPQGSSLPLDRKGCGCPPRPKLSCRLTWPHHVCFQVFGQ